MGNRILNELKQWTKGEIIFYSIVIGIFTAIIVTAGVVLDFRVHYILFGIFCMIAFMFAIKKTFLGYILIVVAFVMYAIIAYINHYFSEIFAGVLFILPYVVVEAIRWIKEKTNKPKLPQGKALAIEIILTITFAAMLFYGAHRVLYFLQNSWLIGSTCAVVAAALFLYSTTFADRWLAQLFLTIYLGLASTCWVFCGIFTDISYAAIALSMIANMIMSLRLFINSAKASVKASKEAKAEEMKPAEETLMVQTNEPEAQDKGEEKLESKETNPQNKEKQVEDEELKKTSSKKSTPKDTTKEPKKQKTSSKKASK